MKTFAEFQTIGFIGNVKQIGAILKISIATSYGTGDDQKTTWNEVTVFKDTVIAWAIKNLSKGDLIHARGTFRQSSYKNDAGAKVFDVTFAANTLDLLRKKQSTDENG